MAKKKFKWSDVEDISFRLIDEHPTVNPMKVSFPELLRYVTELPEFADDPKKSNQTILEAIQMNWYEERSDMEDELGPFQDTPSDTDDLDEEDYRDDKMIDEEDSLLGVDEEDEDEDELNDGFQEEGGDEKEH